jgi:hypothetical protein
MTLEKVDVPVSGSATGIIFSTLDSQDLRAALGAAEYSRSRVMVVGPPDGKLKPWPVLEAGGECVAGTAGAISAWIQRIGMLNDPDS